MTTEPSDNLPKKLLYLCDKISFDAFMSLAGEEKLDCPIIVKNICNAVKVMHCILNMYYAATFWFG